MFKAIGWAIKLALFSVIVLVLGNWLGWGGKTVSDHVKTQLSHAEKSAVVGKVKGMTTDLVREAREGIRNGASEERAVPKPPRHTTTQVVRQDETIPSSERQKLRALIRELNTSDSTRRTN